MLFNNMQKKIITQLLRIIVAMALETYIMKSLKFFIMENLRLVFRFKKVIHVALEVLVSLRSISI